MARTKSGARARAGRSIPGAPREKAASGRGLPASRVECAPSQVTVGEGGASRGQQHVELSFEHQQQPHQHPEHRADGEASDGVRGERLDPLRACKGGAPAGHAPSDNPQTPLGHPSDTPPTPDDRGPAPLMYTSAPLLCTTQRSRQTRAPPDSAALASSAVCTRHTRDSFSRRAASLMRPPPYGRARRRGRRGGRAAARMRTPLRARAAALRSGRVWRTRPSSQQPGIMHVADSSTGVRSGEGGRREEREDRNSSLCN